ncbi:MAG TPA: hypothetical protein VHD62_19005 [Opitutaceae bacterium]|nr:hypothetical protein [Opitutaceae bacterium]
MPRIPQLKRGKVESRGRPIGLSSREDVERRAREIALIHEHTEVTVEDRAQARVELDDDLPATVSEDAESMQSLSRDPSEPATNRGRQAPDYVEVDEKEAVERLALEGVEEAQHEQMVQSRNHVDEPLRSRPKPKPRQKK